MKFKVESESIELDGNGSACSVYTSRSENHKVSIRIENVLSDGRVEYLLKSRMVSGEAFTLNELNRAIKPLKKRKPKPEDRAVMRWLSSCLNDPTVTGSVKRDIQAWFDSFGVY